LKYANNSLTINFGMPRLNDTTETAYSKFEVSDGITVGWVLKATWTRVRILQARVTCRVSFVATHTAMPPLSFAPALGYIGCPVVRVLGLGSVGVG